MNLKSPQTPTRRGTALVYVLVCLGIAMSLVMTSLKSSLASRRQGQHERRVEQAEWLLEAGLIRAHQSLSANSEYTGETWIVSDALKKEDNAEIQIAIFPETDSGSPDSSESAVSLQVTVILGSPIAGSPDASSSRRIQRSRTWTLPTTKTPPE
ncbi:hypothetical protein LOC71_16685 [Rhodopirellula sp. JC740]|uniref:Uncharacterized protein n=1 Tax=Rhodopirellula halodulae TaxID=2894198 RepID=A0ABS8NK18_9BACT|nr:hypothetical protein [Rhodopirellula sp. JC740]MCC9643924.1 hypothetical protein [Rhodopirellula sp. JC740]